MIAKTKKCKYCDIELWQEQATGFDFTKRYTPAIRYYCPDCEYESIGIQGSGLYVINEPRKDLAAIYGALEFPPNTEIEDGEEMLIVDGNY